MKRVPKLLANLFSCKVVTNFIPSFGGRIKSHKATLRALALHNLNYFCYNASFSNFRLCLRVFFEEKPRCFSKLLISRMIKAFLSLTTYDIEMARLKIKGEFLL